MYRLVDIELTEFGPRAVEDFVLLRDGGRGTFHFHDAHSLQWNGAAIVGGDGSDT